jgi:hypothetical protein
MAGWAHFLLMHVKSFRTLLQVHHFGVVVVGIVIDYHEPLTFFDCDTLLTTAGVRLRKGGDLLELSVTVDGAGRRAATVLLTLMPLVVSDGEDLGARPEKMSQKLLDTFAFSADETDLSTPARPMPGLLRQWQNVQIFCQGKTAFCLHRTLCEVADQWSFIEVPALCGAGRESLILAQAKDRPQLRAGLSRPLRRLVAELQKPYFVFDEGFVETRAYELSETLTFVHELRAKRSPNPHGTIIETF